MGNLTFRETLRNYVPPWLSDRPGKTVGFRYLYSMTALLDAGAQFIVEGMQARMPGAGTPTALPYIGRDRRIARGPHESDASYAERLRHWRDTWKTAGNAISLLNNVAAYFAPSPPRLRIVTASGVWYTREPDGTITIHKTALNNWDWDGDRALWSRFWLIIYATDGNPFVTGGRWGGGIRQWGDGGTIGTSALPDDIAALREIVAIWSGAHAQCPWIIVAFDPASFDPLAAPASPGMPDGTWGPWSKTLGGVQVATRLGSARYIEGG